MSRFRGKIGFYTEVEKSPDCFEPDYVEKYCRGNTKVNNWRYVNAEDTTNKNVKATNRIEIIAGPFIYKHRSDIIYVEWDDCKWEVVGVEAERPKLILTLGGVYHE